MSCLPVCVSLDLYSVPARDEQLCCECRTLWCFTTNGLKWTFPPQQTLSMLKITGYLANGLKWTFPPQQTLSMLKIAGYLANGLKWTRTTDLTLIRRAL